MVTCGANRHWTDLIFAMAASVFSECPQCRIKRGAGVGKPLWPDDLGVSDGVVPSALDGSSVLWSRRDEVFGDSLDVHVNRNGYDIHVFDCCFARCHEHSYPHRADFWAPQKWEIRLAAVYGSKTI